MMDRYPVKTAVIGVGRWGKNVLRALNETSDLTGYVIEGNPEHREWVTEHFPHVRHMALDALVNDKTISAVAIATPIPTHASLAMRMLKAGKHVLVEKPLAGSAEEALSLVQEAREQGLRLMTGYVFLYHPIYTELKRLLEANPPQRVECTWEKYGTFGEPIETNLLTHHLALALDLLGEPTEAFVTRERDAENAYNRIEALLSYDTSVFTSHIDRASEKTRHIVRTDLTDGSTLLWDGPQLYRIHADGVSTVIRKDEREPLTLEVRAFLESVTGNDVVPPSGGTFGARVLSLHERLQERLKGG